MLWAAYVIYGFHRHWKWFKNWCDNFYDQLKWTWENAPKVAKAKKEREESEKNKEVVKDAEFKTICDKE